MAGTGTPGLVALKMAGSEWVNAHFEMDFASTDREGGKVSRFHLINKISKSFCLLGCETSSSVSIFILWYEILRNFTCLKMHKTVSISRMHVVSISSQPFTQQCSLRIRKWFPNRVIHLLSQKENNSNGTLKHLLDAWTRSSFVDLFLVVSLTR